MAEFMGIYEPATKWTWYLAGKPQPVESRVSKEEADKILDHAVREWMEKHQVDYQTAVYQMTRDTFGARLLEGWQAVAERTRKGG